MDYKDYYKIMGLDKSASQDEIKRSYRKLARKYHPDVSQEAGAEEKFKALGEAYEILKNPEKRAEYDALSLHWQQQSQASSQHNQQTSGNNPSREQQFEDFINRVFGQGRTQHSSDFESPSDIHARVQISLEDSYHGLEKTLQLNYPFVNANGQRIDKRKTIKIKIPKGVTDKQQIRLKGQGGTSQQGQPGDLYLEIHLLPHPIFKLEHKDVHVFIDLFPWEVVLGGEKVVPTLGGSVKVTLPQLKEIKQRLRLKSRGLPGAPPGDQYIHFSLALPKSISPDAKKLYQQLASEHQTNSNTY